MKLNFNKYNYTSKGIDSTRVVYTLLPPVLEIKANMVVLGYHVSSWKRVKNFEILNICMVLDIAFHTLDPFLILQDHLLFFSSRLLAQSHGHRPHVPSVFEKVYVI